MATRQVIAPIHRSVGDFLIVEGPRLRGLEAQDVQSVNATNLRDATTGMALELVAMGFASGSECKHRTAGAAQCNTHAIVLSFGTAAHGPLGSTETTKGPHHETL